MTPNQLADELDIDARTLRAWLRKTHPRPPSEKWKPWDLTPAQVREARVRWSRGRVVRRPS